MINTIYSKTNKIPYKNIRVGNLVKISYLISKSKPQPHHFSGICIAKKNRGLMSSITVRNIVASIGVEQTFVLNSPLLTDIKVLKDKTERAAKLYYLKHQSPKKSKIN